MLNALKAVEIVVAAKTRTPTEYRTQSFFGKYDLWVYLPIYDEKLCPKCEAHAKTLYYRGSDLRAIFPYLEIRDENTINANVHPHCRCELLRIIEYEQYLRAIEKLFGN